MGTMQHHIDAEALGPHGAHMARAVSTCVHCGFCLPACPTYRVLGEEMDSPRGRIVLMKSVLEGELSLDDALPHIDRCLGCLACVTACPSGVRLRRSADAVPRARRETARQRSLLARMRRARCCSRRCRIRAASRWALRPRARSRAAWTALVPAPLRAMLDLHAAVGLPPAQPLPALHAGAWGSAAPASRCSPAARSRCSRRSIGWAAIRVLAARGVEVVVPRERRAAAARSPCTSAKSASRPELARGEPRGVSRRRRRRRHDRGGLRLGDEGVRAAVRAARRTPGRGRAGSSHKVKDVCAFLERLGMPDRAGAGPSR